MLSFAFPQSLYICVHVHVLEVTFSKQWLFQAEQSAILPSWVSALNTPASLHRRATKHAQQGAEILPSTQGKAVNLANSSNDGLGWLGFTVSIDHDEPEVLWPFVPPCFTSHASVHTGLRPPPQSFHNLPPPKRNSECGPITKRTSSPPGPVTFPQHIRYKKQPNYCNWLRFILRKS